MLSSEVYQDLMDCSKGRLHATTLIIQESTIGLREEQTLTNSQSLISALTFHPVIPKTLNHCTVYFGVDPD